MVLVGNTEGRSVLFRLYEVLLELTGDDGPLLLRGFVALEGIADGVLVLLKLFVVLV